MVKTLSADFCYGTSMASDKDGESPLIVSNQYPECFRNEWPKYLFPMLIQRLFEIYTDIDVLTTCGMAVAPIANVLFQCFGFAEYRKLMVIGSSLIHSSLFLIQYDMNKHGPFNILNAITKREWDGMTEEEQLRSFVYFQQFLLQFQIEDYVDEISREFVQGDWNDQLPAFWDRVRAVFLYLVGDRYEFMRLLAELEHLPVIKANIIRFSPFDCFDWFEKKYYQYLWNRMGRKFISYSRSLPFFGSEQWTSYMKRYRVRFDQKRIVWKGKECGYDKCARTKWKYKGVFWKCAGCKSVLYHRSV